MSVIVKNRIVAGHVIGTEESSVHQEVERFLLKLLAAEANVRAKADAKAREAREKAEHKQRAADIAAARAIANPTGRKAGAERKRIVQALARSERYRSLGSVRAVADAMVRDASRINVETAYKQEPQISLASIKRLNGGVFPCHDTVRGYIREVVKIPG
ncbi:hypothetical protein [Phyllobacterium myrsinacearum]|uniref:Uncharacterized protein n=1 Tax=Phyllobacterium myrsinacearum TaxID=28101 RepID=A0A839EMH1_9HYPH|nr:hypothetical protein [Phyllobacterium myrsinacearum]MBA8877870.1 hypothetical protein [Phyllobacterium myrsinacearum]